MIIKVELTLNDGYDEVNDAVGGLADVIRYGFLNKKFDYIKDIIILTEE